MTKVMDVVASSKYFCLGIGNGIASAEADYDDLLIYDRALSAEDVKLLYAMERRVTDFSPNGETGIDAIEVDKSLEEKAFSGGYYDLSGRSVPYPAKSGIYLYNGRKILVK